MKKEYIRFEENGVSFEGFYDSDLIFNSDATITSIKVEPGIDTVTLGFHQTRLIEVRPENNDVFPWVKTIVIKADISNIKIQNQMFPNVESVISENRLYETRDMLVSNGALLNSFYKNDTDVLNLHGITSIMPYALSGCKTKNVINTNHIAYCYKHSFDEYEPLIDRKTGIKLFENIVVGINSKAKILEFPDDRYNLKILSILNHSYFNKIVKIHRLQTLTQLIDNACLMPKHLIIDLKNNNIDDGYCSFKLIEVLNSSYVSDMFSEIEIINSRYFKSEDGIIYTADGAILLYCPRQKHGNVTVKKGTQIIAEKAFQKCKKIESVILPDTIVTIHESAFTNCQELKTINLNEGLKTIGVNCFSFCNRLKEIEIPSSVSIIPDLCFRGCPLKSIKLNEGVTGIDDNAFNIAKCDNLTIPKSLMYIKKGNFQCLKSVTLKRNRFPLGLLYQIISSYSMDELSPTALTKITYKNDIFYIPHIDHTNSSKVHNTAKVIELHSIEIIKNNIHVFLKDITSIVNKVMIGLEIFERTNDMKIERILKTHSLSFLRNQIREKQEENVIRFIKTGIVESSVLKMALKMTEDENMITASAYILNSLKEQTDTTNFDI